MSPHRGATKPEVGAPHSRNVISASYVLFLLLLSSAQKILNGQRFVLSRGARALLRFPPSDFAPHPLSDAQEDSSIDAPPLTQVIYSPACLLVHQHWRSSATSSGSWWGERGGLSEATLPAWETSAATQGSGDATGDPCVAWVADHVDTVMIQTPAQAVVVMSLSPTLSTSVREDVRQEGCDCPSSLCPPVETHSLALAPTLDPL